MAMGCVNKVIEIRQSSEQWINVDVIGYVVAEVRHWGRKNWRQPDGVDAQFYQVWQSVNYALEVSYAILIAVLK